jgi:hypothetical protein
MHDRGVLAGFYRQNFGVNELGRSADGDITLSDSGFNVTLFLLRPSLRELRMERPMARPLVTNAGVPSQRVASSVRCDARRS